MEARDALERIAEKLAERLSRAELEAAAADGSVTAPYERGLRDGTRLALEDARMLLELVREERVSNELECWDVDGAGQVRLGVVGDQLELEVCCPAAVVAAVVVEELGPVPIVGQVELGQEE